jgi:hypothetical protein
MEILLQKGEVLRFAENGGWWRLVCQSGCIWITQQGDGRDFIMEASQGREFGAGGDLVVEAWCESKVLLQIRPPRDSRPVALRALALQPS